MINNFHQLCLNQQSYQLNTINTHQQPSAFPQKSSSLLTPNFSSFCSKLHHAQTDQPLYELWEPSWTPFQPAKQSANHLIDPKICPNCTKLIRLQHQLDESQPICSGNDQLGFKHFIHEECIPDCSDLTVFTRKCSVRGLEEKHQDRETILGGSEFITNLTISNLVGTVTFFKGMKKLIEKHQNTLIWAIDQHKSQQNMFQPNLICIPVNQFRIQLNLNSLKIPNRQIKLFFNIDLENCREGYFLAEGAHQGINFAAEFIVVNQSSQKKQLIDLMNFKYRHETLEGESLVFLNKLRLTFSQNATEQEIQHEKEEVLTGNPDSPPFYKNKGCFLEEILKTQYGSKQYQKRVKTMSHMEISCLIEELKESFPALIQNQFANYFIQMLFSQCNYQQRMHIFSLIQDQIVDLVITQEGTFTFQFFVDYMTAEQIQRLYEVVENEIIVLSVNEFSTYFVKKLIKKLPLHLLQKVLKLFTPYIIQLGQNKKGVCILKEFLRALIGKDEKRSLLREQFISLVVQNFQKLINNEYGNYIIQEVYQRTPSSESAILSQKISENIDVLAHQKYACLVIFKCLKIYWKKQRTPINMLKEALKDTTIQALQKNREGSKVLWEIQSYPELCTNLDFFEKDSIKGSFVKKQNKGYYSGEVGTSHTCFSSALEHIKQKNTLND